jgi:hypothetical protein
MIDSFTKKYQINGPVNVIRLTDGNKIIYIFGDIHLNLDYQNECEIDDTKENIDIDKFIASFLNIEKTKQFDLFAEMYPEEYKSEYILGKKRYIDNFVKLFQSKLKKTDKEVKINKLYPNFRFHFMDIRNTIPLFYEIFFFLEKIDFEKLDIKDVEGKLYTHLKNIEKFILYLKNNKNKYINKITNKYTNNEIKKIMNKLYNMFFDKLVEIKDICNKLLNLINEEKLFDKKIYNMFLLQLKFIINKSGNLLTILTDLYFLRRFLDKNYIKNVILYTGNFHLADITYLLVNYFNFTITNIYYYNNKINPNPKILETIIKKNKDNIYFTGSLWETLTQNYNKSKDIVYQCVNLFNFPDNFS